MPDVMSEEAAPAVDDRALLLRHRGGDVEAFLAVYRRHARPLFYYAVSLTRDRASAEDVVQEAFLKLLRLDPQAIRTTVQALLYADVRNRVIDAARRDEVRRRE